MWHTVTTSYPAARKDIASQWQNCPKLHMAKELKLPWEIKQISHYSCIPVKGGPPGILPLCHHSGRPCHWEEENIESLGWQTWIRQICLDHTSQSYSLESEEIKTTWADVPEKSWEQGKETQNQLMGQVKEEPMEHGQSAETGHWAQQVPGRGARPERWDFHFLSWTT